MNSLGSIRFAAQPTPVRFGALPTEIANATVKAEVLALLASKQPMGRTGQEIYDNWAKDKMQTFRYLFQSPNDMPQVLQQVDKALGQTKQDVEIQNAADQLFAKVMAYRVTVYESHVKTAHHMAESFMRDFLSELFSQIEKLPHYTPAGEFAKALIDLNQKFGIRG